MKILTTTQRTDEWRKARVGMLTASRAADMLATIKRGEAAARRDLRVQLVVERLTGYPQDDGYVSTEMQRGSDKEPEAFAAYEALTGRVVNPVGFVAHDTLMAGCSPDGVIGDFEGILELKCPKSATHLRYLMANTFPETYRAQINHLLWITGAQWTDFVSFDDRFPPPLHMFYCRVQYGMGMHTARYDEKARAFLAEVDAELDTAKKLGVLMRTERSDD